MNDETNATRPDERSAAIDARYSALAEESCCLSCGGAARYSRPAPGEVCVDLGSGRGTDALRLAEAVGEKGRVYGIDLSEGMLEKARRTAERLGARNVQFLRGELEALPLPDGGVDLVTSNCTINHAADKPKVWDEIFRVLRPGGRFVVSDIYALERGAPRVRRRPGGGGRVLGRRRDQGGVPAHAVARGVPAGGDPGGERALREGGDPGGQLHRDGRRGPPGAAAAAVVAVERRSAAERRLK